MNRVLRRRIGISFSASWELAFSDVLSSMDFESLRLPGGTAIFTISRPQFMKYPGS